MYRMHGLCVYSLSHPFSPVCESLQHKATWRPPCIFTRLVLVSVWREDNVWWEAHLARKGIPRVFLSNQMESKTIAELAFGHGALTSSEDKARGMQTPRRNPRSAGFRIEPKHGLPIYRAIPGKEGAFWVLFIWGVGYEGNVAARWQI